MNKFLKCFIAVVILFAYTSVATAAPKRPTGEQVTEAITKSLKKYIPVQWVGNLAGGHLVKLKELKVVRAGNYNNEKRYWPVQVQCVGIAGLNDVFNQGKQVNFDKVGDFLVHQDDYGDWQAELRDN